MRFGGRERVSLILSHRFEKRGNAGLVQRFFHMEFAVEVVYREVWF